MNKIKTKLMMNTIASLMLQVVTIICGFITPRLFLNEYGSDVNGLIQSVTQFLGVISFLELGVGQVIQSALYKPLAHNNQEELSIVISAGNKFFRKIAYILVFYIVVLSIFYPFIIDSGYSWMYTTTLIISIGLGLFAQYYFGITDHILLNADQRGYIQYFAQIFTLIINTIACVVLIKAQFSIQIVKLVSSLIFIMRPIVVRIYINRNYSIARRISYDGEPIKQKWNGMAQHISAFILNGTDNIVLTMFSTLANVSIYSVYHLVVYGVHQIYQSLTAGLHSLIGDLIAKQENKKLSQIYAVLEPVLHFITVWIFTCTGVLMIPFVIVYTNGIHDTNYVQPLFSILIVIAHATQCIKTVYNMPILGAGHYKQVQRCHIITAIINIVVSIITVERFGLIGVAVGTVIAMTYQMVWMAWYDSKNIIKWPFVNFLKQIFVDVLTVIIIVLITSHISLQDTTYLSWFLMAIQVAVMAALAVIIVAFVFYGRKIIDFIKPLLNHDVNK